VALLGCRRWRCEFGFSFEIEKGANFVYEGCCSLLA
jgi:hypothetical protein